jgi:hypothetical protein
VNISTRYQSGLINGKWFKIQDIELFLLLKAIKANMKITKAKKR